jgi:hypothetical protein
VFFRKSALINLEFSGKGKIEEPQMSKKSLTAVPEVFLSDGKISKAVYQAVERGELRKLNEDPKRLIRRNWYNLVAAYYSDAIIADRTALEGKPAADGSVFLN